MKQYPLNKLTSDKVQAAYELVLGEKAVDQSLVEDLMQRFDHVYQVLDELFSSDAFRAESTREKLRGEPISEEMIVRAFRVFLGRDPKPQGIKLHLDRVDNQWQLISVLRNSGEWRLKYGEYLTQNPRGNVAQEAVGLRYIFSKSTPRSGHHFLVNMLSYYFGMDLRYCEFYQPADCCHATPCTKAYDPVIRNRYFLQKSHDLNLRDSKKPYGGWLIQYRGILGQIQSHFDWALKTGAAKCDDTMDCFKKFAERDTRYFIRFYDKWIVNRPGDSLILTYEDLTSDTERQLANVVQFITESDDIIDQQLQWALAQKSNKVNTFNSPETIRNPSSFRHFDSDFFRKLEQEVYTKCPGYEPAFHFLEER